jgi:autophagy-related protein 9
MSDIHDFNKHTFLSRVLGSSAANSTGNGYSNWKKKGYQNGKSIENDNDLAVPFLNDDNTELQFSNTYSYMDNNRVKDMLMSEISFGNNTNNDHNINDNKSNNHGIDNKVTSNKKKLRSNISINFNSESEESSEDDNENQLGFDINNTDKIDALSKSEKDRIREELELELQLENDDNKVPESLLFENVTSDKNANNETNILGRIEQSVIYQMKEAEKTLGPTFNNISEQAKKIANKTIENPVFEPPPPTFLYNRPNQQNVNQEDIQRQIFNARKLPSKERALWMWANITNLDIFLNDVYEYYIGNGWHCIALSKTCDLLIIIFVIWLTSFMGNCIDYSILMNENVNKLSQVYDGKCYSKIPFTQKIFYYILLFILVLKIKNTYKELSDLKEIKLFYNYLLNIDDSELQTISWPQIVKKILILKNQNTNAIITDNQNDLKSKVKLNAHDIANRLMRKENYMIAIFNKNILNKALKVPFLNFQFLTKTMEWNLKLCIFDYLFNDEGQLKVKVLSQHHRLSLITNLRKRFRIAGLLSIFLTPFLVLYFILYYFLKLFYDFKTNPGLLNARSYSPIAKWKMREYNELPHLFDQRINSSIEHADDFLNQFPKELSNILLKFVSFITGSIVTVLVILTIINHENFLNFELTEGKTVLFYISTLGALFTICKNSILDSNSKYLFNPEISLKKVAQYTHYLPASWDNRYHTPEVKNQFCDLYNLKLYLIFKELCSLLLLPYVLYFSLPQSADKIVDFFRDFTIHVDGIGYVCSFAMFTLEENKDHIKPEIVNDFNDDNDEKMMKSYMYFLESYGGNVVAKKEKFQKEPKIFKNPTQNLIQRNIKQNNGLLKSAILNSRTPGNGGIPQTDKTQLYQDQMEETVAGLPYSLNTQNYVNDLSNSMMLGESFQMGFNKSNDYHNPLNNEITEEDEYTKSNGNISSGGVLGLLNQVYKHK